MRTDEEIRRDVVAELKWVPEVNETDIAVNVYGGVVTLTGFVGSSFQKYRAERAARRLRGVAAVANDIQVRWVGTRPTDPEIARATVAVLQTEMPSAASQLRPMIHEGRVTLLGEVEWQYQRELAERLMHAIPGVVSVRNSIRIRPKAVPERNIKEQIEAAFRRLATVDAERIAIEAKGPEVTLRGEVRSCAERDAAVTAAWSAPGVSEVNNQLIVRP